MNNVFNKKSVSYGVYMLIKDNKRTFSKNLKYFTSSNIPITVENYTLCGSSGVKFFSYAVLNGQGVMIKGGMVTGRTNIKIDSTDARYLMVCGLVEDLEDLMVVDGEYKYNPSYMDYDSNSASSSSGSSGNPGMVFTASNFTFVVQDKTYKISGLNSSLVKSYTDLPSNFLIYVTFTTKIVAGAAISIYDNSFQLCYADGEEVSESIDVTQNVIPLLFDKKDKKARLPYSSVFSVSNEDDGDAVLKIR
jgi:hypothetical protein